MKATCGSRIKNRLTALDMKQADLANKTKISKATLSQYISNKYSPTQERVESIADVLGVDPVWLMGYDVPMKNDSVISESKLPKTLEPVDFGSVTRIPIYGRVPAGIPLEAVEDIDGYIGIPAEWINNGQEYFGLKVVGDSMYPKYMDGDTIVVRKQSTCESGQDAVVYVNDNCDATLKKVIKNIDHIILQPINPEYEPKMYEFAGEGCPLQIAGIVVEIRRKV